MAKRKRKRRPTKKLKGRERRLSEAPEWVWTRGGKAASLLKRYRKHFGVDWECAIAEVQELGVKLDEAYLARLRETIAQQFGNERKQAPIRWAEFALYHNMQPDQDETFAYIAGYTSGGAPFGVTWEEMEAMETSGQFDADDSAKGEDARDTPF